MVINTNNNGLNPGNTAGARGKAADVGAEAKGANPSDNPQGQGRTDDVVFSNEAQAMSRLESSISAADEGNNARVAAIKQALADGTYTINASRIADKMITQDDLLA